MCENGRGETILLLWERGGGDVEVLTSKRKGIVNVSLKVYFLVSETRNLTTFTMKFAKLDTNTRLSYCIMTSWLVYLGDRIAKVNRKLDKICS